MFLANFVKIDMVKLKINRESGVLTSGIKRDGHQKKTGKRKIRELEVPGIRRDDCIICSSRLTILIDTSSERRITVAIEPAC